MPNAQSQPMPVLPYSSGSDELPSARLKWVAFGALALALLGFPVGALTSILLETNHLVESRLGEWFGFLIFMLCEGLAAALGTVIVVYTFSIKNRGGRSIFLLGMVVMVLGGAGSIATLIMMYVGVIE